MNTPRISDKLAFPSFMADIFSLVLNSENETLASGCFSWLSMMKCEYTTHPPPVLVFWCSFSVPGEMHTEQLSIDGGLNESLGEAKGQTGTIIYLIQSHNILLNSILPNFFPYCI